MKRKKFSFISNSCDHINAIVKLFDRADLPSYLVISVTNDKDIYHVTYHQQENDDMHSLSYPYGDVHWRSYLLETVIAIGTFKDWFELWLYMNRNVGLFLEVPRDLYGLNLMRNACYGVTLMNPYQFID